MRNRRVARVAATVFIATGLCACVDEHSMRVQQATRLRRHCQAVTAENAPPLPPGVPSLRRFFVNTPGGPERAIETIGYCLP